MSVNWPPSEVVYDSILENKQKTKSFWEQLMLTANVSANISPSAKSNQHNYQSNISFHDGCNHQNLHPPGGVEEVNSPKIYNVSSDNSKYDEKETIILTDNIEKEMIVNSEPNSKLFEEHEKNARKFKSEVESKIVLEIREMKEREKEWKRNQLLTSLSLVETSAVKNEDTFIRSLSAGVENYSELGNEKQHSLNEIYRREKETPIEREIRLICEREEELRRQKLVPKDLPSPVYSKVAPMNNEVKHNVKNGVSTVNQVIKIPENNEIKIKRYTALISEHKNVDKNVQNTVVSTKSNTIDRKPNRYQPNPFQKGVMKRFLASKGKISSGFTFPASIIQPTVPIPADYHEKDSQVSVGLRLGYRSAEDKIQFELVEMKKREEELRLERSRLFVRSLPDLLSIDDDKSEEIQKVTEISSSEESDSSNKGSSTTKLWTTLSNPSLVDMDAKQPFPETKQKRHSALIQEWEDRIKKNNSNE